MRNESPLELASTKDLMTELYNRSDTFLCVMGIVRGEDCIVWTNSFKSDGTDLMEDMVEDTIDEYHAMLSEDEE